MDGKWIEGKENVRKMSGKRLCVCVQEREMYVCYCCCCCHCCLLSRPCKCCEIELGNAANQTAVSDYPLVLWSKALERSSVGTAADPVMRRMRLWGL